MLRDVVNRLSFTALALSLCGVVVAVIWQDWPAAQVAGTLAVFGGAFWVFMQGFC